MLRFRHLRKLGFGFPSGRDSTHCRRKRSTLFDNFEVEVKKALPKENTIGDIATQDDNFKTNKIFVGGKFQIPKIRFLP